MKQILYAFTIWLLFVPLGSGVSYAADTIRVGTTQPLTGKFKDFGEEQLRGIQMWVHDINARGSLLGKDVELVYYDDYSEPERSAVLYRQLIEQDKVDLLIGPYSSPTTLAASTVAEKYNLPMVASAASAEQIWQRGYKNIFGVDVPSGNYMLIAIAVAQEKGARTFQLISSDSVFSQDVAIGVREELARRGLTLVDDEIYQLNQTDFSALAKKLSSTDADVLLGATYLEDAVAISKAFRALPVKPRRDMVALTVGPAIYQFGTEMGAYAEGIVGVVQWLRSVRKPGGQDFAYRYRLRYGHNPGVHGAIGYSAGQVLEAAVRLAKSTDKDAVREQLKTMEFNSLFGLYKVDDTGRQIGKKNYLLQWQDGKRRLVAPPNEAERELIYPRLVPGQ
jgi:branched-chain amino acid transport system substrate-binding protein